MGSACALVRTAAGVPYRRWVLQQILRAHQQGEELGERGMNGVEGGTKGGKGAKGYGFVREGEMDEGGKGSQMAGGATKGASSGGLQLVGLWVCRACCTCNDMVHGVCLHCGGARYGRSMEGGRGGKGGKGKGGAGKGKGKGKGKGGKGGGWACNSCKTMDNWFDREICRICGTSWQYKDAKQAALSAWAGEGRRTGEQRGKGGGTRGLEGSVGCAGQHPPQARGPAAGQGKSERSGKKGGGVQPQAVGGQGAKGGGRAGKGPTHDVPVVPQLPPLEQLRELDRVARKDPKAANRKVQEMADGWVQVLVSSIKRDVQGKGMAGIQGGKGGPKFFPANFGEEERSAPMDEGLRTKVEGELAKVEEKVGMLLAVGQGEELPGIAEARQMLQEKKKKLEEDLKLDNERREKWDKAKAEVEGCDDNMGDGDEDEDGEVDEDAYLWGDRRWKHSDMPPETKIQRSKAREGRMEKAKARIEKDLTKLEDLRDMVQEQIHLVQGRLDDMDRALEKEAAQRKVWAAEIIRSESEDDGNSGDSEEVSDAGEEQVYKRRKGAQGKHKKHGRTGAQGETGPGPGGPKIPDCVDQILRNVREEACEEAADMVKSLRKWVHKAQPKGVDLVKIDSYWHQQDRLQEAEQKIKELEKRVDTETQISKEPGKVLGQLVGKYQDLVLRGLQSFEPTFLLLQQAQEQLGGSQLSTVAAGASASVGSMGGSAVTPRGMQNNDRQRSASRSPRGAK